MGWINKKKLNRSPWIEKKQSSIQGKMFKNINKDSESISDLNSKLKARLEAFEKEQKQKDLNEPEEKVLYSEEIQNIRLHGLENRFAEPENGRIFVLGYPYSANATDTSEEPAPSQTEAKKSPALYDLKQSTLNIHEVKRRPPTSYRVFSRPRRNYFNKRKSQNSIF